MAFSPSQIEALRQAGLDLQSWQIELLDRLFGDPSRTDYQRALAARRVARLWLDESRVILARSQEEGLTEVQWASLQQEAQILRKCADTLFEAVG